MTVKQTKVADIRFALPLPLNVGSQMAETALTNALDFCAKQTGVSDRQVLLDRLRQGDNNTCGHWHYGLARQVAEYLGVLDQNVKAVYVYEYEATAEDVCFREYTPAAPVHLIVWAQRKTSALNSLVTALDSALVQNFATLVGMPQWTNVLDVQVVDDAEVNNRTGYGALLSSIHLPPDQVWKR